MPQITAPHTATTQITTTKHTATTIATTQTTATKIPTTNIRATQITATTPITKITATHHDKNHSSNHYSNHEPSARDSSTTFIYITSKPLNKSTFLKGGPLFRPSS